MTEAPLGRLIQLRNAADVLGSESGPRWFRPVATELFRSQHTFNTRVAEVCLDWFSLVHEPQPRQTLRTLLTVDGGESQIRSHRKGLAGRAVVLSKQLAVLAIDRVVNAWGRAQRQFNRQVLEVLLQVVANEPPDFAPLQQAIDETVERGLVLGKRFSALRHWLDRQTRFNELLLQVVLNHKQMLLRSADDAYRWWREAQCPSSQPPLPRAGKAPRWALAFRNAPSPRCLASLPAALPIFHAPGLALTEALRTRLLVSLDAVDAVLFLDGTEVVQGELFVQELPEAQVWYFDHDRIDVQELRSAPRFVPAFSPVLFSEQNYVGSCLAVRADSPLLQPETSEHQPASHWATSELLWQAHGLGLPIAAVHEVFWSSTAEADLHQHRTATAAYWLTRGAEYLPQESPSVRFRVPEGITASLIVPLKDKVELLQQLVNSLYINSPGVKFELICISNNSVEPETFRYLNSLPLPSVKLLESNQAFNWSALNNLGARHASGDVLVFLNNDVEFKKAGWLEQLCGYALQPEIGAVGAVLQYPDGAVQHAGVVVGMKGLAGHVFRRFAVDAAEGIFGSPRYSRECSAVTGAVIAVEKAKFAQVGGFDEGIAVSGGDVEWCLRHAPYQRSVVCLANLGIVHHESLSRGASSVPASDIAAELKAYQSLLLNGDPYFHPALSTASTCALPWLDGETAKQRAVCVR